MLSVQFGFYKIQFRPGSAPDPAGGAYYDHSDLLVGWGGGYPLSIPRHLDAFSIEAWCLRHRKMNTEDDPLNAVSGSAPKPIFNVMTYDVNNTKIVTEQWYSDYSQTLIWILSNQIVYIFVMSIF